MLRIKKYINVFVKMGVYFGILIYLPLIYKLGIWTGSLITIKYMVLWDVMMAIIIFPADYLSTRKLPKEAIYLHQEREIKINGDFEKIFEQCLNIMKNWKAIKSIKQIKGGKIISARTKMSIWSIGTEEITLNFDIIKEPFIKISIKSQPVMPLALIDFGKNYKYVEWLKEKIERLGEMSG
jgi:hypothetical protein